MSETLTTPQTHETDSTPDLAPVTVSDDQAELFDVNDLTPKTPETPEDNEANETERTSSFAAHIDRAVSRIAGKLETTEGDEEAESTIDTRTAHLERITHAKKVLTRVGKNAYEKVIRPTSKTIYQGGTSALISLTGSTLLLAEKVTTTSAETIIKAGKAASDGIEKRALKNAQDRTFKDHENGYNKNIQYTENVAEAHVENDKIDQRREAALIARADALERKSVRRELRAERRADRRERFSKTRTGRFGRAAINLYKRTRNGVNAAYNAFKAPVNQ